MYHCENKRGGGEGGGQNGRIEQRLCTNVSRDIKYQVQY